MKFFDLFKKKKVDCVNHSEIDIVSLLKNSDKNTVFVDVFMWLENKCSYGDHIEVLSKPELSVFVVREFFDEVMNGGFEQFLDNSSGNHFNFLIESLRAVDAQKILNIYEDTIKLIPKLPTDREKRYDAVEKIMTDEFSQKLSECDNQLFEIGQDYFENIVYQYIMSHKEFFKN